MKTRYFILFFFIVVQFNQISCAAKQLFLSVPFQNITLNPNVSLQANYTIGNHKMIFCFENTTQNVGVGVVTWPYQGLLQTGALPILLKTQAASQGEFADNSGILTVSNNQTTFLVVSCVFGF